MVYLLSLLEDNGVIILRIQPSIEFDASESGSNYKVIPLTISN